MWHAEISSMVLRHYPQDCGYELHIAFNGVAFAKSMGRGVLFIEGALRTDGSPLRMSDWRDLGLLLKKQFGIHTIKADRRGKEITIDTNRALKNRSPDDQNQ